MSESPVGKLPADLPRPEDDGAADALEGRDVPPVLLESTTGERVDLAALADGTVVVYVYPGTGVPGEPLPPGWMETPGAFGCTAESCAFRDHAGRLKALGASVVGVSAQPLAEQRDFAARERIPYPLLNDSGFALADALELPTFEIGGLRRYRRLTFVARRGRICKAFYPVFPPDEHPAEVLSWLGLARASPEAPFTIQPVGAGELDELLPLVRAYCDFYKVAPTDRDLRMLMHGLLAAGGREGLQLLARDPAGEPVGFATLLFTWSTTSAARAAVMNDLYVAPHARGQGLAEALIDRCVSESAHHGAAKLTWTTRPDNERAQAVYDRVAARESWVTYRIDLPTASDSDAYIDRHGVGDAGAEDVDRVAQGERWLDDAPMYLG